jgi:hypothetical protein
MALIPALDEVDGAGAESGGNGRLPKREHSFSFLGDDVR